VNAFPPNPGRDDGAEPSSAPPQIAAGELGMVAFIAALSMFFIASIVVYLLMRRMHQPWPPAGFPALPSSLWLSTLDILFTSITIQGAVLAARRGDATGLRRNLVATLVLACGFLGLQSYAWYTIWLQVAAVAGLSSAYLKMFYMLTGLHAAHVLGGLVPLVMITVAAYRGMYGRKKNAAVRYTAVYWHFLDAVWCAIFVVVYLL
jgi:heme/copper-type cytochrome/quinol oxidase subunit 3